MNDAVVAISYEISELRTKIIFNLSVFYEDLGFGYIQPPDFLQWEKIINDSIVNDSVVLGRLVPQFFEAIPQLLNRVLKKQDGVSERLLVDVMTSYIFAERALKKQNIHSSLASLCQAHHQYGALLGKDSKKFKALSTSEVQGKGGKDRKALVDNRNAFIASEWLKMAETDHDLARLEIKKALKEHRDFSQWKLPSDNVFNNIFKKNAKIESNY